MPPRIYPLVRSIYDEVHAALWALLVAGVLYFLTAILPQLPAKRAEAERQRIREIAAENRYYCGKFGMPAGTHFHVQCVLELQELRARIERRLMEDEQF